MADSLGSALDDMVASVASFDVNQVEGAALATAVLHAERLVNAAHALSSLLLERFEQHGGWSADGALSAAAWMAQRTGSARAALRSRRRQGAALTRLPGIADKARTGHLSTEHLRALGECVRRHPELAAEHEVIWLEQAEALNAEGFRVATRHWLEAAADVESSDKSQSGIVASQQVSTLHLSRTFDGWLRIDGSFAPPEANLIEAALGAGVDRALRAAHDGDPSVEGRPASALRADALVDLLAQTMRHEPSEVSAPDRYRVAVMVRYGQPADPAEAACDASAYRVVLGAAGEVLDVGRQTNRWPNGIRRAITVRDRGCVFPGCDRPPSWTDIHHCVPWGDDGATSVENGALVCRRHHTFIHQHHWSITIDNGIPTTRCPDGMAYTIQRWHSDLRAS